MASGCSREAASRFLTERGGSVKNEDSLEHFRPGLSNDPPDTALVSELFQMNLDNAALVNRDDGTSSACLGKGDAHSVCSGPKTVGEYDGNEIADRDLHDIGRDSDRARVFAKHHLEHGLGPSPSDDLNENLRSKRRFPKCAEKTANDAAEQEISAVPACGIDAGKGEGAGSHASLLETSSAARDGDGARTSSLLSVTLAEELPDMGNKSSKKPTSIKRKSSDSRDSGGISVPQIAVVAASPLPQKTGVTVSHLPENRREDQSAMRVSNKTNYRHNLGSELQRAESALGVDLRPSAETKAEDGESCLSKGAPLRLSKLRRSKRSRRGSLTSGPFADCTDEGQSDSRSLSGSDSNTPRSGRKNFLQLMINSSPQVRRSLAQRNTPHLGARDAVRGDGDPGDDESGSVALDPLEHQWMMCASDGEWDSLHLLLLQDPNLVNKKDFVTGFTCFHWAAKLGRQELLSLLVNFGKQNAIPVNINARSSAGYTPLHLATIHNHPEVVKFLVGACEANVEARDYSGRMAWQYVSRTASKNMYDILGGMPGFWSVSGEGGASCRAAAKVLPYNLVTFGPFSCLNEQVCDGDDLEKPKLVSRKASLKSRLPKIRVRSRIVHSTSFRDPEEVRASARSIVRSRPKSNIFG
ncbi:ankyrin repeat domain-containing protein SOWAHC [Brienomyrus brachyistius]|uniref:ankyrin repeat domain-containing protein SOWAHC n=1 Tax=Brienomyrus brachyistius TaxID=42636 RepID=UPI0020B1EE02|nr:ankyrin repeat domain-containing protein SOWAHC [Brienomyrus brachyistius]